uniref:Uncharacterized protein n=1 Tax=Diadromus pulchellus ascovirus 4a TaxID=158683 RepID=Q9DSU4_9VIRU|nr:hypothetical protein [Diadromus pulchellus ascovirus 4a]
MGHSALEVKNFLSVVMRRLDPPTGGVANVSVVARMTNPRVFPKKTRERRTVFVGTNDYDRHDSSSAEYEIGAVIGHVRQISVL